MNQQEPLIRIETTQFVTAAAVVIVTVFASMSLHLISFELLAAIVGISVLLAVLLLVVVLPQGLKNS